MSVTDYQAEVGPWITGHTVEQAIIDTLKLWLGDYLADGEEATGLDRGSTPRPRGWTITGRDIQKYTSDQLPCIVVMAGGILTKPLPQGYPGHTTASWAVDVGCIFNAAWGRGSRERAQLMVRAISLVLLQRPLEGLACVVDMNGEAYDELDFSDTRTYSAAVGAFTVEVEDMMWRDGGPPPSALPPDDPTIPFEPWTTVETTEVEVQILPTEDHDE